MMAENMTNSNVFINTKKKRKNFHVLKGVREIEGIIKTLPNDNECYKFLSMGGFSAICFIQFVATRAKISNMLVTTLRVGKKELKILDILHTSGKVEHCDFIVGSFMKNDSAQGKSYQYYEVFNEVCKKNNWNNTVAQNHSKIILMDTELGKFVIETSSNLNENPKCEQFSFEKSDELYDAYYNELIKYF